MYVLLVANVIFYLAAGFDQFLVLLLATAVSYVVACKMGKLHEKLEKQKQEEGLDRKQIKRMKANNKKQRKRILIWGLVLNIGILVVFKYTNFLLKTGYSILDLFGIGHGDDLFKLIMPLGISFFTFQILSYLIDVYKGKVKAQKNFLKYLLYISFFPSVVQGPIPRYADLGTQLYEEHRFEYDNLRDGALLILWGFAKKLILAERLGTFVDQIIRSTPVCSFSLWRRQLFPSRSTLISRDVWILRPERQDCLASVWHRTFCVRIFQRRCRSSGDAGM